MSMLSALAAAEAAIMRAEAEGFHHTVEALRPIVDDLRRTVETQTHIRRRANAEIVELVINS